MITYFVNRWTMRRKFEQTSGGWVYRHLPRQASTGVHSDS